MSKMNIISPIKSYLKHIKMYWIVVLKINIIQFYYRHLEQDIMALSI